MLKLNVLCYVLTLAISVALLIYGFMLLFEKQRHDENDVQVIQRQLRGLAFVILAPILVRFGNLCNLLPSGKNMMYAVSKAM